jgi:hypothetical protein
MAKRNSEPFDFRDGTPPTPSVPRLATRGLTLEPAARPAFVPAGVTEMFVWPRGEYEGCASTVCATGGWPRRPEIRGGPGAATQFGAGSLPGRWPDRLANSGRKAEACRGSGGLESESQVKLCAGVAGVEAGIASPGLLGRAQRCGSHR